MIILWIYIAGFIGTLTMTYHEELVDTDKCEHGFAWCWGAAAVWFIIVPISLGVGLHERWEKRTIRPIEMFHNKLRDLYRSGK